MLELLTFEVSFMKKNFALLAVLLMTTTPALSATLSDEAVSNIAKNSHKTCLQQAHQAKRAGAHCQAWAACYGQQVQKTTSLEEMKAADALVASGKRPGKDFIRKMMRAASTCAQKQAKAGK
jgi:hypothetical protein